MALDTLGLRRRKVSFKPFFFLYTSFRFTFIFSCHLGFQTWKVAIVLKFSVCQNKWVILLQDWFPIWEQGLSFREFGYTSLSGRWTENKWQGLSMRQDKERRPFPHKGDFTKKQGWKKQTNVYNLSFQLYLFVFSILFFPQVQVLILEESQPVFLDVVSFPKF